MTTLPCWRFRPGATAALAVALSLPSAGCQASGSEPAAPGSAGLLAGGGGGPVEAGSAGRGGTSGGPAAGTTGAEPGVTNWEEVKAAFSTLRTVAGRGESDNGNEWQASFEGALATSVELSRPHMALADEAGNIYIADKESHGIRKVTLDGTIHSVAGTNTAGDAPDEESEAVGGALSNPNGLWVRPDGTFYVLDLDNAKVRRVTREGRMSTLVSLGSLAVGRGLWVADDESEALIAGGTVLWHWSPAGGARELATGFASLGMVLKTEDGRTLVGDRGAARVYEVAEDGSKTPLAGDGTTGEFVEGARATETAFDEPRAIWPYAGGLFVGLHQGCRIIYIDDAGYAHLVLQGGASSHAGDGEPYRSDVPTIGEVRSLSISALGDLIFVENDAGFVRMLSARGR